MSNKMNGQLGLPQNVACSFYSKENGDIGFLKSEGQDVTAEIGTGEMEGRPVIRLNLASLGYTGLLGKLRWFFRSDDQRSSDDARIKQVLTSLKFSEDVLQKIYNHLGNDDQAQGEKRFLSYVRNGKITFERVGFSNKEGQGSRSKFYIVINDQKGAGGLNRFFIGFSQKGTPCAVLESRGEEGKKLSAPPECAHGLKGAHIAHIKRYEEGNSATVKVMKLGGMSLEKLLVRLKKSKIDLSQAQRLEIYRNIFSVLAQLHGQGIVHRDVKEANLVLQELGKQLKSLELMLIDLDTLKKENESCSPIDGTFLYFSPERFPAAKKRAEELIEQKEKKKRISPSYQADPKDDVWAALMMICSIEWEVSQRGGESLLSAPFLKRYHHFMENRLSIAGERDRFRRYIAACEYSIEGIGDLFSKDEVNDLFYSLQSSKDFPLDAVVRQAASLKAEKRSSAQELHEKIEKLQHDSSGGEEPKKVSDLSETSRLLEHRVVGVQAAGAGSESIVTSIFASIQGFFQNL